LQFAITSCTPQHPHQEAVENAKKGKSVSHQSQPSKSAIKVSNQDLDWSVSC